MKKGEAVIFRSYSSVVEQLIESNERASKIEADINEKILAESVQQEEDEDSQLITFSSGKNIVNDQSEEERDAMIDFELGIGKKENPKARNTFVFNQDNFNEMIEDDTPKFKSSSVSVRQQNLSQIIRVTTLDKQNLINSKPVQKSSPRGEIVIAH